MALRDYRYANALGTSTGIMKCAACSRKIVVGEYRYHETAHAYVNFHREC